MKPNELQSVKHRFGIIGNSELLNRAIDIAVQVAPTDLSVLITGESGVGKENFPQIIHNYSHRKHGPYIAVNCGAIPEGTIDSELFGHEKGSFTGATADRKGYFEVADGGTIFLDEVGELPLSTQVRLLRVLETGEFIKVGSSKTQKTNVRVVAATNLNITQAIRDGRFREDLYYRLNTVPVFIPPLRDRKEDIPLLFRKFAADFAEKYKMPPIRLSDDARQMIMNYYWNGNVRQLKNITEQISVIEQQREITPAILRSYLPAEDIERYPALFERERSEHKTFNNEREILYQVLFDMKKDMNDLKKIVNDLMLGQPVHVQPVDTGYETEIYHHDDTAGQNPTQSYTAGIPNQKKFSHVDDVETFQDVEDYQDENEVKYSLADMECELIKKSLEKNNGKRKLVAKELEISERTLYRKIKDYGIDS
ncbi:MAG TPA: sigma-54 dependent transcriptional regulator [Paludibacteraceae bacterium]|nr:sigma-54 dependent transcriptional regulator [Paludibacteraceae bacterium]HPT42827.1 sigma-54 dependent transcriptional regulator [Paludibacteraceae bacterium]